MATPHLSAAVGDIAPLVLMPGDPRRAQRMAEDLLDDARLVTEVRGILGFTGTVGGEPVSIVASGMGGPSIAIYATELARFYGVRRIARVGTAGGLGDARIGDVIVASAAHSDSAMTTGWVPGVALAAAPAFALLRAAVAAGDAAGAPVRVGPVFSSDTFYGDDPERMPRLAALGTVAVEMEAATLYAVGAREGIETLAVLTITDHLGSGEQVSSAERESGFHAAARLALAALRA